MLKEFSVHSGCYTHSLCTHNAPLPKGSAVNYDLNILKHASNVVCRQGVHFATFSNSGVSCADGATRFAIRASRVRPVY